MCWLTETYHTPCGHFGLRTVETPCARGSDPSLNLKNGCWDSIVNGCTRVDTLCTACSYRGSVKASTQFTFRGKHQKVHDLCHNIVGMLLMFKKKRQREEIVNVYKERRFPLV